MSDIRIIPKSEVRRVLAAPAGKHEKLRLVADMCRLNTLATVKRAGSGHLGSSFSSLDIVTWLYHAGMKVTEGEDRDVYFSSKGHDVPGQYAVLYSLGLLSREKFVNLRRLDGTCGHPDVSIPGIEANTGSLGMGISKGKGMLLARRLAGRGGRVFVMTGDGELQEGQIYESLQTAVTQGMTELTVIVDHNKVQSDKPVSEISDLGDLEGKFHSFGWEVRRCDGHDMEALEKSLAALQAVPGKPGILIADTIKGKGVSFMEHPAALAASGGLYPWHSGAPDDVSYAKAFDELATGIGEGLDRLGLAPLVLEDVPPPQKAAGSVSKEYVADAFGAALVEAGDAREDLVVLDCDLSADCRLRAFEEKYPERFVENGIAEQDMVSMAGGLALQGCLPVVNTFAAFLASRANEQIYNNCCEKTRIIYVGHYAGLVPAGPGLSHQSLRDISLLRALPNFEILQPGSPGETRMALEYAVGQAEGSCFIRLIIGPSPRPLRLPAGYRLEPGRGAVLAEGGDAVLFACGPVMLHEALLAAERLREEDFSLKVVNMPWLNRVDGAWLGKTVEGCDSVYVLDDHSPEGGLGDTILNGLEEANLLGPRRLVKLGVEGHAAWGTPAEVLRHHGLDGVSLAARIAREKG